MNSFDRFLRRALSILIVCTMAFALGACEGDDGKNGAAGSDGVDGVDGVDGTDGAPAPVPDAITAAIDMAEVESCATCHGGVGDEHQALYNKYTDGSADAGTNLTLALTGFTSAAAAVGFDVELTIEITRNGLPLENIADLGMTNRFYITRYDATTGEYFDGNQRIRTVAPTGTLGEFIVTGNIAFNPDPAVNPNVQFFGYIGDEQVIIDDVNYAAHMGLYDNLASASLATGVAATDYESAAVVSGCETCHGTPYMKHGNRVAAVEGLPDFAACKSCHYDDREGGHGAWQYMVDDPLGWATDVLPDEDAVNAAYPYTANVMNDTHMSHAMEFPYPQSMANCATCHAGNVDLVLADENFTAETCKSCHAVQGVDAWPELVDAATGEVLQEEGEYYQSLRAPSLDYLWTNAEVEGFTFHNPTEDCTNCHKAEIDGGFASTFSELHTGYDPRISNANGDRYDSIYTVSIDDITMVDDLLTIDFSASDAAIAPEVSVSFYGWGSKHFIVASHSRDGSAACTSRGNPAGCRMEFAPGDTNPLFIEDAGNVAPVWSVTLDMAAYVPTATLTDDIPTMIGTNVIRMAEVTITAELELDGVELGLDAVTQTYDVQIGGSVNGYFKGAQAAVNTDKCDACHDQLAVTFHGGSGRAGDIVACKNCHVTTSGGSHLEMASRSIDSYVHAIHTFQPFDLGSVDAANPVEVKRTAMHEEHTFPNFTITNCEGCHEAGTFNVPDQTLSMPGLLSASDSIADRNIGSVPETVTGPASRACGGCHRAELINEDKAGELASFNAHTEAFGTFVENDDDDLVLFGIIDKIMTWFE